MRTSALLGFSILSFVLPFAAASEHMKSRLDAHRRHDAVARRPRGDLAKRQSYSSARFTYYDVGLGACGQNNVASDFIVALDSALYNGGAECFKSIVITYGGQSTTATIMDECPGCPEGGLDFSEGLFEYFAALGTGVIYGEWTYADGSGGGPASSSVDPPTSTSVYVPPTTSTSIWTPTTTSSIWTPTTTSTTWTPTTTSSSSIWTPSSSSSASSSESSSSSVSSSQSASSSAFSSSVSPSSSVSASSSGSSASSSNVASSISSALGAVESGLTSSDSNSTSNEALGSLNLALVGMAGLVVAGARAH